MESKLTAPERYARYLFDSMSGEQHPPYKNHTWQGNILLFATEEDYILSVEITPEDTRISVSDKLFDAYHSRIDQEEDDRREAEEIARFENPVLSAAERGFFFHLLY